MGIRGPGRIAFLGAAAGQAWTQCARVYHNAAQSIPNATLTVLAFNSERFDTDNIHNTVTNNSRLTCKTAGKYQIVAQVHWVTNVTGRRHISIRLNGATNIAQFEMLKDADGRCNGGLTTLYDLAVNDYLEAVVYQDSGGALNVQSVGNYTPEFMMARVG